MQIGAATKVTTLAFAAVIGIAVAGSPAQAEQHGDGYGPRNSDDLEYGGGQGQFALIPAPFFVAPPYVAFAPPQYAYPAPYPAPVGYGYG